MKISKFMTLFPGAASALCLLLLAGCASNGQTPRGVVSEELGAAMAGSAKSSQQQPAAVANALLPPLQIELPKARQTSEERFSVSFNNIPAQQFFTSVASGTRYNVLVHPDVSGTITANLRDVTLFDALDAIRDLYGYDYKVEGTRIVIKPLTMQTAVFQVNYLTGIRKGSSDTRVSGGSGGSGSVGDVNGGQQGQSQGGVPQPNTGNQQGGSQTRNTVESAKVSTTSNSDFWSDLRTALEAIIGGSRDGRSVVVTPQSGVVVVRAMPEELRNVSSYLKATQISVDRQVILEAKILEVVLNDSFQSGVNWASFASFRGNTANRVTAGQVSGGSTLTPLPFDGSKPATISGGGLDATAGFALGAAGAAATNSLFGLAFQTSNFASLISFLESQGSVNVLSSPRISTVNNQKAVLKVGTDEFFVTNVSSTTTTGTATTTTPNVTLQPFFSGVVLDVTPQIDDRGNIVLHIHPSVSQVNTVNKAINLGSAGSMNLPLPSSNTSETDSIVRGQDGQVIAIGGLMQTTVSDDQSGLPGTTGTTIGALFGNKTKSMRKRELVILLKPTIVQGQSTWNNDILDTQRRIDNIESRGRSNR